MTESVDPRVWAVIISCTVSLIIAIIGLINSNKSLKNNFNQQKILEELKLSLNKDMEASKIEFQKEIDKNRIALELKNEELIKSLKAIDIAIGEVQKVKASLQLILNSNPNRINFEELIRNLELAQNSIIQSYQNSTSYLGKDENDIFHKSKNITIDIYNYLERTASHNPVIEKVIQEIYKKVKEYRSNLSELQNLLRDSKFRKLQKYL